MPAYRKPERVFMKGHAEYTEKWVQARIKEDPTILGLGDLVFRQEERIQPSGGRLDLLLQDAETKERYEVELQLGATDETHIVRTVEYWDVERKRYPQYEHYAVLVAEDITSRFLNVVGLFNGAIPLIAIQVQAYTVGENLTLVFTTVMDAVSRGYVDEDETAGAAPADRAFWENKASRSTVAIADQLLAIVKEFDPALELKYNQFYIGLAKNDRANNFVIFGPQKSSCLLEPRIKQSDEIDKRIEQAALDQLPYEKRAGRYRIRLGNDDVRKHADFLRELMRMAFDYQSG